MKTHPENSQCGIAVLTMILLVIILLAVLGSVVAYSRGSAVSAADQTAKLMASAIVDQANTFKDGFDLMMAKGSDIDTITFNQAGLFNGTTGTAVDQQPPADAVSASTKWLYAKGGTAATGVKVTAVGAAGSSYAVLVTNVKDAVCKQINRSLYNVDGATGIPWSNVAAPAEAGITRVIAADFVLTGTTTVGLKDTSNIAIANIDGWYMGCVSTNAVAPDADKNVYYNIIKPI